MNKNQSRKINVVLTRSQKIRAYHVACAEADRLLKEGKDCFPKLCEARMLREEAEALGAHEKSFR